MLGEKYQYYLNPPHFPRTLSTLFLNPFILSAVTTSSGKSFQSLQTLLLKQNFATSKQLLLLNNLHEFPLVFPMFLVKNNSSSIPSNLFKILYTSNRSALLLLVSIVVNPKTFIRL